MRALPQTTVSLPQDDPVRLAVHLHADAVVAASRVFKKGNES